MLWNRQFSGENTYRVLSGEGFGVEAFLQGLVPQLLLLPFLQLFQLQRATYQYQRSVKQYQKNFRPLGRKKDSISIRSLALVNFAKDVRRAMEIGGEIAGRKCEVERLRRIPGVSGAPRGRTSPSRA